MATASPAPTPNPNAMRFQLDTTLPATINFKGAADAADHPFAPTSRKGFGKNWPQRTTRMTNRTAPTCFAAACTPSGAALFRLRR